MGYLHEGHLSLVDLVHQQSDVVFLSIFVNPTQFGVGKIFPEKYPHAIGSMTLNFVEKVDYVFAPQINEIYASDASTFVSEEGSA